MIRNAIPLFRAAATAVLLLAAAGCGPGAAPGRGPAAPQDEPLAEIELWPAGSPGQLAGVDGGSSALYVLTPASPANGAAVLVIPGGGYGYLSFEPEGRRVAEWLAGTGITAFVLRYRHAPAHRAPAPLDDARRAMRVIRARASEFGVDPARVGVMGFSAGGHLAAMTAVRTEAGDPSAADPLLRHGTRPDFAILLYPVISMDAPHAHAGSVANLLGDDATAAARSEHSAERHVSATTPPTFLVHTREDGVVPLGNSLDFHAALERHRVPAALHVFVRGRHGLGLGPPELPYSSWTRLAEEWIAARR